ncbi:hypothetical protein OPQ81_004267 [Rhizoctonia solani]|nr:hypothetical protein OPQ81_004267 [Rhizoctonia solani]
MDPSQYYTQQGLSSQLHQAQYQGIERQNQMQISPVDNQAIRQYIHELYQNPTLAKSGPTNDPAFYAKAQQDLLSVKHKLEQMLLANQQHAELAQMSTQIQHAPSIHPQHTAHMNAQHQHGAWTGSTHGSRMYQQQPAYQQQPTYQQQAYTPPMVHAHADQLAFDVTMHDPMDHQAQSAPQAVRFDPPPSHQPQHQSRSTHETPLSAQQQASQLLNVAVQPQSRPLPQTAPSVPMSQAQNVQRPQPEPQPQRSAYYQSQQQAYSQSHPLQPGPQPNQADSAATQKGLETMQKQMDYLQFLAQQHQRTQQTRPSSQQSSPASSQVALPSVPRVPTASGSNSTIPQPAPQPTPFQRLSPPQQDPLITRSQLEIPDAANPSPAKVRSRKPFALHDLRPERRQSAAPSNGSGTPSREINTAENGGPNAPSSVVTTPTKSAKNADNGLNPVDSGSSQKPSAQSGVVPSDNLSSTSSPLARPVQIADEPASIPVNTTNATSQTPNASMPALNKPTEPVLAPSSTNIQKQSGGGSSKMKVALENLHIRGVDCIALVREAAEIVGVPVKNLPEETGAVNPSVPLFAPGQPLDSWASNLQVTRVQGDNVVKSIWDLMKKKAREIGIDAEVLRHPPPETATDGTSAEGGEVTNYGNPIPSCDGTQVTSSSSNPVEPETSKHVTDAEKPHITPGAANLATEPRPPSTQPLMHAQVAPSTHTAPTHAPPTYAPSTQTAPPPAPERPASTPVPPLQKTQSAPMHQTSNPAPSVQPDPAAPVLQTYQLQLSQRHQYNPYPNGPPPRAAHPQQQPLAHMPAYVPPNLSAQAQAPPQVVLSQAPAQTVQLQPRPRPRPGPGRSKSKRKKTAALDYLRSIGIVVESDDDKTVGSDSPPSEPAAIESDPTQTEDKGKGKARDVEEPTALVPPKPINNGNVAPEPAPLAGPSQVLEVSSSPPRPHNCSVTTPIPLAPSVVHAPTPVQPSIPAVEITDAPIDVVSPLAQAPPAPAPVQDPAPTTVPEEIPPPPIPIANANADAAPPVSSQASAMLSPPIASISALPLNNQSSPAEHTPLKRKRESRPSDITEAGPGPNTEERARQQHAVTNKHDQKRPKMAKRDSTTTGSGKKSSSAYLESPYPDIPLPDNPLPNNSWAQSYATAMNLANRTKRPLFRPETPPPSPPKSKSKPAKKRMVMEVVIPLRKKGKLASAEPSSSMIDLTLSDTGTEREEDLELDELVQDIHDDTRTEQEPDLKMLRRRLRPHMCEWIGCTGPPVLSSVELLGVHLNRYHLNCRDPHTKYYMCRWGNCVLQFKNARRLWNHISEKHVRHPLYCPYQDCDRTTSERYRMIVHVNRAHRGNAEAKLRVFAQPEDFPPDRADPEGIVLRPDAFPEGGSRHARIGPIILRNISAPSGFVSVPRQAAGSRAPELPLPQVLVPPMTSRSQVRLGTVPPDALGEELEREAGPPPNRSPVRRITTVKGTKVAESSGKAKANPSPARSHITITSDESSPEPENRRGSTILGRGRGRGQVRGGINMGRIDRYMVSQSPPKTPRLQVVVELPQRGSGGSSAKK